MTPPEAATFTELLDDIYETAVAPSAWERALHSLAIHFRCASAAIEWLDAAGGTDLLFEYGADQKYLRRLIEQRDFREGVLPALPA